MTLEKWTGASNASYADIAKASITDGVVSAGMGHMFGMKEITKGRGNMASVFKGGLTRMRAGQRMSKNVVVKGIKSGIVDSFGMDLYTGFKQYRSNRIRRR